MLKVHEKYATDFLNFLGDEKCYNKEDLKSRFRSGKYPIMACRIDHSCYLLFNTRKKMSVENFAMEDIDGTQSASNIRIKNFLKNEKVINYIEEKSSEKVWNIKLNYWTTGSDKLFLNPTRNVFKKILNKLGRSDINLTFEIESPKYLESLKILWPLCKWFYESYGNVDLSPIYKDALRDKKLRCKSESRRKCVEKIADKLKTNDWQPKEMKLLLKEFFPINLNLQILEEIKVKWAAFLKVEEKKKYPYNYTFDDFSLDTQKVEALSLLLSCASLQPMAGLGLKESVTLSEKLHKLESDYQFDIAPDHFCAFYALQINDDFVRWCLTHIQDFDPVNAFTFAKFFLEKQFKEINSSNESCFLTMKKDAHSVTDESPLAVEEMPALEGKPILRQHQAYERDSEIIKRKKKYVLDKKGALVCESCGFDFEKHYGKLGFGFCEVHHTNPIAERGKNCETNLKDLVILCANCHRMIHRLMEQSPQKCSVEDLKCLLCGK